MSQNDRTGGNSFSMDPNGTGYWHKVTDEFPRNITVLDAGSKLVDDKFQDVDVANGIYNHHVAFYTMNKAPTPFAACGSGKPFAGVPVSLFMGTLMKQDEEAEVNTE
jgi:hypothetical protein